MAERSDDTALCRLNRAKPADLRERASPSDICNSEKKRGASIPAALQNRTLQSGARVSWADWQRLEHRFNDNQLRQLLAQRKARVADLADEIRPVCDEADDLVFAEAQFAQPVLHLRRGAQPADAQSNARSGQRQRTFPTLRFTIITRNASVLKTQFHGNTFPEASPPDQPFIANDKTFVGLNR